MKIEGLRGAAPSHGTSPRKAAGIRTMEIDKGKIDDAIPALLFLSLDRDGRSWKSFEGATGPREKASQIFR